MAITIGILASTNLNPILGVAETDISPKKIESELSTSFESSSQRISSLLGIESTLSISDNLSKEIQSKTNHDSQKIFDSTTDVPSTTNTSKGASSGVFGTAPWHIDSATRTLVIEGGTFPENSSAPWSSAFGSIDKIDITSKVTLATDSSYLFSGLLNLSSVEGIDLLDTSKVITINGLFQDDIKLQNIDLSTFNTSALQSMSLLFSGCSTLKTVNLSNFDTSKVMQMNAVFAECTSLETLDLSSFDTSKVVNMGSMFLHVKSHVLTFGNNFKFTSKNGSPGLFSPSKNNDYTGKWQNVGTGTLNNPMGKNVWSSSELMSNLNLSNNDADTYVWQPTQGQPITIKYVDEDGKQLAPDDIMTGKYGTSYDTIDVAGNKSIPGYSFKEIQGERVGVFSNQAKTVSYIFTKDPIPAADVTVKYVDEKGEEIAPTVTLKGNIGDTYTSKQETITGYSFKEVQGNVTGPFTAQPQTVTYLYSEGLLQFVDVPQTMSFEDSKISSKTSEVKRKEVDWKIKVEDTRPKKTNWRVSVKLTKSFKDSTGDEANGPILLYRQVNQSDQWLDNSSEVNVFNGVSETDKDYYDVSWTSQSGPLLSIAPGAVKAEQYKGEVQWNLLDTPV